MVRKSILGIANTEMGKANYPFRSERRTMMVPVLSWPEDIRENLVPEVFYNSKGEVTNHKALKNNARLRANLLVPESIPEYWEILLPEVLFFHMHSSFEITQVISGKALYIINNECIEVSIGDILMFNVNIPHFWYPDPEEPAVVNVFYFFPSLLLNKNLTEEKYGYLYSLYSNNNPYFIFNSKNEISEVIKNLLNNIFVEFKNETVSYQLMIIAKLLEMSSIIIRYLNEHPTNIQKSSLTKSPNNYTSINTAIDYINKNYLDPELNLAQVSRIVSMNSNYFSNLFKKSMGISFVSYVTRLRISKAFELLSNRNLSITEISQLSGYDNFSSFYRSFTAVVGVSPSEYKKQMNNKIH